MPEYFAQISQTGPIRRGILYVHKWVQVPRTNSVKEGVKTGQLAAQFLEDVVKLYASEGWEFCRVDEIGIPAVPECLAGLFASGSSRQRNYVITFRKPANSRPGGFNK